MKHPARPLALVLLLVASAAPARAECPSHPADLAPGVLGDEMPTPTWTVIGDGALNVQDVLTLLQAAVSSRSLAWEEPFAEDCPSPPGDIAPGTEAAAVYAPDMRDGVLNVSDVVVALRLAVNLITLDPSYLRPVVASARSTDRVLAGEVVDSVNGNGLPGVTVSAFSAELPVGSVLTDGSGAFLLQGLPAGAVRLELDGSTCTAPTGKFSTLELVVESDSEGTTVLRSITLPDEEDAEGATDKFTADETGTVVTEIDLSNADGDVGIATGPGGKVEDEDGPVDGEVDLAATPLDGDELPGKLTDEDAGDDLSGTGTVAVSPADGKFTAGSGLAARRKGVVPAGFDLTLPNRRGLPVGTMVDIWRWAGSEGRWVNHTSATGFGGIVVDLGGGRSAVFAAGAATQGGVFAAALPVDPGCTTILTGRVIDESGTPLEGVFVDSDLGIYDRTGPDGTFYFAAFPAYSGVGIGDCVGLGFDLRLRGGLHLGKATSVVGVPAMDVFPGGYLDLFDLTLGVPDEACLSGLVLKNGVPESGPVSLVGPDAGTLTANAEGRFFASGLTPGDYTASFLFSGERTPREFEFELFPRQCTTTRLELNAGSGSRRIEVQVFYDDDDEVLTPSVPAQGALVELRGTDSGSAGGLQAVTGATGRVVFDRVDGPFDVTALLDVSIQIVEPPPGQTPAFSRTGAALRTNGLPSGRIGIPLLTAEDDPLLRDGDEGFLQGSITNLPAAGDGQALSVAAALRGLYEHVGQGCCVDPFSYITTAYRDPYDVVFGLFQETPYVAKPVELAVFGPFPTEPLGPGPPDQMEDLDYDSVPPIVFDRALGLSYSDFSTLDNQKFYRLFARADGGRGFSVDLEFVPPDVGLVASVQAPDPASAGAAPWDFLLELSSEATIPQFPGQYALLPVPEPLPAPLDVSFVPPPEFVGLMLPPNTTAAEVAGTSFGFDTVGTAAPGYDALVFDCSRGASVPGEPENAIFVVYLEAAASQVQALPPTPRPVVFPDSLLILAVQSVRSAGLPASFEVLFDDQVNERFPAALDAMSPIRAADANRWFTLAP